MSVYDSSGATAAYASLTQISGYHGFRISVTDSKRDNIGPSVDVHTTDGRVLNYPQQGGCCTTTYYDKYYPIDEWRLDWGGHSSQWASFVS